MAERKKPADQGRIVRAKGAVHMYGRGTGTIESRTAAVALHLEQRRRQLEIDIVASIAAVPLAGVRAARAAGFKIGLIAGPDLLIVALAAFSLATMGRLTGERLDDQLRVAALAKHVLIVDEWWDSTQTSANLGSARWSDCSLERLFDLYPGPAVLSNLSRELEAIDQRQRQLRAAHDHFLAVLNDHDRDNGATSPLQMPRMSGRRAA